VLTAAADGSRHHRAVGASRTASRRPPPGRTHGYRPLEAAVDQSGFYDAEGRLGAAADEP
jgi:hypothetical protein